MSARRIKKANSVQGYFKLDELITRILCDTSPRGQVHAAYLFGETPDNEASVLKAGAFLYAVGPAKKIAVASSAKGFGYPGFKNWRSKLLRLGIPAKDIVGVMPAFDMFPPSTSAEAHGIVLEAARRKWKSIYVVAPPLHQVRAFVSTVSSVIAEKSNLSVYSFHGIAQSWEEHIVHSQGILKGTRSELLREELERIEKYYRKGDLVSAEDMLRYLDRRDRLKK